MASRIPRILLTLLLMLAACAAPPASAPTGSPQPSAGPLTLIDDAGRAVEVPARTPRIVSLAPSNTEIVCALHACDRVVGVTDYDDYPPEVVDRAKVVIGAQVDVEKVVAAHPDLILAAGNELTPTTRSQALSAQRISVLEGARLTMRGVRAGTSTARPASSVRVRGPAVGWGEPVGAEAGGGAAHAASIRRRVRRIRGVREAMSDAVPFHARAWTSRAGWRPDSRARAARIQ